MTPTELDIAIPADSPVVSFRRTVKAPLALVFGVWTEPEHLRHWWGPRALALVVSEVDLRVGGGYRFVSRAPDGQEFAFHGVYREIEPPRRLVSTFVYEGLPDNEVVETVTFELVEGGTLISSLSVHASLAARDAHVAMGMEGGLIESHVRLDELLESMQATEAKEER
jgi:uncharacterized protein YndB with AHSA1/START domain